MKECRQGILLLLGKTGLCGNVVFQIVNLAHGRGILVTLQRVLVYLYRIGNTQKRRLTHLTAARQTTLQRIHHRNIESNEIAVLPTALIRIGIIQFYPDLGTMMCRISGFICFPFHPAAFRIQLVGQIFCLYLIFTENVSCEYVTAVAVHGTKMNPS